MPQRRGIPHGRSRKLGRHEHVGAVMLDRLEHGDRPSELLAHLGVVARQRGAFAGNADRLCSEDRAARSTSTCRAPGMTSAVASLNVTRAALRVGSRFGGVSTATPPVERSTMATSSPAATSRMSASPPPRTTPAGPDALPASMCTSPASATAPVADPEASRGRSRDRTSSGAAATMTALAITVGTKGPGATARPSSSTTITSSGSPNPDPPYASLMCSPSQPRSARSSQKAGRPSVCASSRARAAPRASRFSRKSDAVSASLRWSSVMAIDMR